MNIKEKIVGGFFSSTMWFGFLIIATTWLENNTQMLTGLVDSQYAPLMGYGIGIAIWGLRWITTKPVEEKAPNYKEKKLNPIDQAIRDDNDSLKDF